ncbi:MAG: hypothetical protein HQ461_10030, partial [Deltaproteobacteria bacterium]|nr:hypothetical protein [Deltaproteobacteria bacterium]
MGLFRIAFLLLALAAGACIGLVAIAPAAFHDRTAEAAEARLRTATQLAATLEEKSNQERLRFATEFATSPLLTMAVSSVTAADATVTQPTRESIAQGYREAARSFLSDTKQGYDLVGLYDLKGSRIDSTSVVTTVASEDFVVPGRVSEVVSGGRPLGALVSVSGRIFGVAAVAVRSNTGVVSAVLLVAEEYGDAMVSERRLQLGFPLAFHVDDDIVVHDLTDPTLFSTANAAVMKLERGKWPAAGKGEATTRSIDGRSIFAATAALATSDADAAFRSDVGVALLFDAPAMNRNLLAILVEGGSFDEIPAIAVAALAGSLMFFFLGLLLLDVEQRAPARRLAKDVSGLMTTNQPAPLDISKYGNHLRSLVSSINEFIESRKTFMATKRTKVESGSQETVTPAAPAASTAPIVMVELEMEPIQDETEPQGVRPSSSPSLAASPMASAPVAASDPRPSGSAAVLPPPVDLEEFLPRASVAASAPNPAVRLDKEPSVASTAQQGSPATVIDTSAVSAPASTMSQPLSDELLAALVGAADSSISYPQEPPPAQAALSEVAAEVSREVLADELTAAAEAALTPAPSPLSLEAKLQTIQGGGFMTGNFASASGTFPGLSGSYPSVMGSR